MTGVAYAEVYGLIAIVCAFVAIVGLAFAFWHNRRPGE